MKIPVTNRKYIVFVILAGIVGWLFCAIFHPFEPRYQGKTLSAWTTILCDDNGFDPESKTPQIDQQAIAADAIRHIGTRALPYAIRLCREEDSGIKKKLLKWADADEKLWGFQLVSAEEDRFRSWQIFQALGAEAKPAIPKLVRLLGDDDYHVAGTASSDLTFIGPDAIAPLVVELTNQNAQVRRLAAHSLGDLGTNLRQVTRITETNGGTRYVWGTVQEKFRPQMEPVYPALLQGLKDEDYQVQDAAAYALSQCAAEPSSAVPAIIAALEKKTNFSQTYMFLALRHYKTNAIAAVPLLLNIVKQESPTQIGPALRALREIDPETAKPFIEMRRTRPPDTNAPSKAE